MARGLEATNGYNPLRIGSYDRLVSPGETTHIVDQRLFPASFDGYDCALARELGLEYVVLGRPIEEVPHLHAPAGLGGAAGGPQGVDLPPAARRAARKIHQARDRRRHRRADQGRAVRGQSGQRDRAHRRRDGAGAAIGRCRDGAAEAGPRSCPGVPTASRSRCRATSPASSSRTRSTTRAGWPRSTASPPASCAPTSCSAASRSRGPSRHRVPLRALLARQPQAGISGSLSRPPVSAMAATINRWRRCPQPLVPRPCAAAA